MQFAVALERVIAAPRSKVYRAWLDPGLLARWMGPDDFTVTVATVDLPPPRVTRCSIATLGGTPSTRSTSGFSSCSTNCRA